MLRDLIEARHAITDAVQKARGMVVSHVFHRNGEPIRYFRRAWVSACIGAGLGKEVKNEKGRVVERVAHRLVHDLRRSAARNMLRAGIAQRVAMEIGGWRTPSVFQRYAIVDEASMGEALAKLADAPPAATRSKLARTGARK